VLLDGGARSTKTMLICAWLVHQAVDYPGARILIARKNRNAAEKSVWGETLSDICRRRPGLRMSDSTMEVSFSNSSMIRVDGLDDQDRVDKILGTEYAHIFFNEATQVSWQTVTTVLSRLAQNVPGLPCRKALFDCNPKSQRHWLYKAGVLRQIPDGDHAGQPLPDSDTWARMNFTPYDNPHLPADALQTLEAMTGTQRRRLLSGEWCEAEGAVYDEFDEDIHIIAEMPKGWESWQKVRGIDFGYTNPFCCLWGALDGDGRLYIYNERYVSGQTVQVHAEAIKAIPGNYQWTVADHDAEDRATLHAAGISTQPAIKDVERGIKSVKERLKVQKDGRSRLFILKSCREIIGEFYDYAWAQPKDGKNSKEEPVKDHDHAMDTVRYMVAQLDLRERGGLWIPGK
jgi:phage terminase large subunit